MTAISRRIVVAIAIAVHLGLDLIWPRSWYPLFPRNELFVALGVGFCSGQVTLVATWAALAPGRWVVRLPWALLLATLIWLTLALGFRSLPSSPTDSDTATLGLTLLVGVLIVQIPLWAANRWLRWRLVLASDAQMDPLSDRQYQLSHLLWGVFLFSLCLGLSRLLLPKHESPQVYFDRELLVILPAMVLVNLVVAAPCIWCAFASWRWMLPLALIWLPYACLISVMEVGTLIAILGPPGDARVFVAFGVISVVQGVTVWLTLLVLRLIGFQLVRRKRARATMES